MAKVLVSMSDKFLERINEVADNEQRTRSELIREALRAYIRRSSYTNTRKAEDTANMLEELIG
ncbi:MAG: ribbon-helix-helix protein, CopG family [Fusobacterium sp.]|nr:ribbon-helix-helix protein, CopG family [Fusobacterium sp.]